MSIHLHIGAVRGNNASSDNLLSGQDANSDTDAHDIPVPEEVHYRPTQSYPGCFGLPYQDHNYGAQPPMSPTPPKSPSPPPPKIHGPAEVEEEAKVPAVSNEEEVVEDSITRCICGFLHDDGYMICCDKCSVWQHIDCMEIDRNNIPESYCCEVCEPRELDVERAKMIQRRRREEIDTSATDTDPEEPANALASLGRKPVQPKPKGAKQRRVSKAGARLLKTGRLAKSQQLKREKLKLTKKEKENVKDALKKQKVGKTGVTKEKKIKKKLNTSLSQNKADFSFLNCPLYAVQDTKENEYSPEILDFLSHAKTNGVHSPHSIGVFPEELLVRLYQVSDVKKNRKGLEATDTIVAGKAVIEFKGRVMLRQHCQLDPSFDPSQPYVLFYSKFEGLDLCIDASAFGGDARFIRRSCAPNAEMCHIIDSGNLRFFVQAKKEITKGSEITIPFDFNYQESPCVDCACGRVNCPVVKFWKKVKPVQNQKSPEKPKRKRQASGEGRVRRNSQGKNSPVKTSSGNKSPVKCNLGKNLGSVTTSPTLQECSETVDVTASEGVALAISPVVKPAPPRRSSRAVPDIKEEKDVKPAKLSQNKELPVKAVVGYENIQGVDAVTAESLAQPVSESEADSAGEYPRKKMTREERKNEAIMKTFEKIAKREERRKEALARMDKKHIDIKEEPTDRSHTMEAHTVSIPESGVDKPLDPLPVSAVSSSSQSPETEGKVVMKLEDSPVSVDSPQKSARHKRLKRKRRNSRVMSALEPLCSSPAKMQMPFMIEPSHSGSEEVKEQVEEQPPVSAPCILNASSVEFLPASVDTTPYMYHKKKKMYMKWGHGDHFQYLFNDGGGLRSPEGRTDPLELQGREKEIFVSFLPGPRSTMEHIQRRNSTSAADKRNTIGNAKKRWLKQAIEDSEVNEKETTSSPGPSSTGSTSPPFQSTAAPVTVPAATATGTGGPPLHSPLGSPSDFVTPLKKRRLAPEFQPSMVSAAHSSPPTGDEASIPLSPHAELTATSTNTAADDRRLSPNSAQVLPSDDKRCHMKAKCLFGRKSRNGFVGPTDSGSSVCDGPVPVSSASTVQTSARSVAESGQEELSMDGLTSSTHQTVGFASAGTLAVSTEGNTVDSLEASGGSLDSSVATASSSVSYVVCNLDSGVDIPLVDSSDAAVDAGLPRETQQSSVGSYSIGVCSSDNEVSTPCVHNVHQEGQCYRKDEVVAESSSAVSTGRSYSLQDQDGDVSESQPVLDRIEVEDEGNEASGSVSVSEELSKCQENVSFRINHAAADCQVNSSQDFPPSNRTGAFSCSPTQGEAESKFSSLTAVSVDQIDDTRQENGDDSDRTGVSSALDSSIVVREKSGVSSAKDIAAVSSVVYKHRSFTLSETECGPSSSTQTVHSGEEDNLETMICNSSDVAESSATSFASEESNVDSTTQNGRIVHPDPNHCDIADSHLQTGESEESCCDSNSDEKAQFSRLSEGGSVSSSGPADSQCDMGDHEQRGVSTNSCAVSSSTTSVSSSNYSRSHVDLSCGTSVSSSVYSGVHQDSAHGRQVLSMLCSTSTSSVSELSDLPDASQSSSNTLHTVTNALPAVNSASVDPMSVVVSAAELDNRDSESVGTSEQSSISPFPVAEQCEASTSSVQERRFSDDSDSAVRSVSSSLFQNQSEGDLSVSSAGLDTQDDRFVVNGEPPQGGLVSSFSEDSSGSSSTNPCTTVSSSEAQAAPITKRKVSLSEYRNRRKDKTSCAASTSSTSPKSSSDHHVLTGRGTIDSIGLAPLPLFEPVTVREPREPDREKREKHMSLSDRLRIEFGLDTTSEEEEKANSSGCKKPSGIPPPPPIPPNGKFDGMGVRRLTSAGPRTGSTENEEDGQQASTSLTCKSSTAVATTTGGGLAFPTTSSCINSSHGQTSLQPGYTRQSRQHSSRPSSVMEVAAACQPHQHPSTAIYGTGTGQKKRLHPFHGPGAAGSQLSNGSHASVPAVLPTGTVYAASTSQGQPPPQSFAASAKQQQPPPPPPPPNTAYSPYIAQSRTHYLRPQTSPVGPGHQNQLGPSGSFSHNQHSAAGNAPVGNGVAHTRHAPVTPSSNHPHGHFHFNQFSHSDTVKHKGSYVPERKRH